MKYLFQIILIFLFFTVAHAENNLQFFIEAAFKNNLKLKCRETKSKVY